MNLSEGKRRHLDKLSNSDGIIAALAMDQRSNLRKALGAAKGVDAAQIEGRMLAEFKSAVSSALSSHATAILLDPEFGLDAARARAESAGLLLSYELSGYDNSKPGRLPDFIPNVSGLRLLEWGANAVKVLLYYTPDDSRAVNDIKHAAMERIGAECEYLQIPFFLELLAYDPKGTDEKSFEFAQMKPRLVIESVREYSKPRYHVDVLKIEAPINPKFTPGAVSFGGRAAYTETEAVQYFKQASDATDLPFIFLSAGVSNEQFTQILQIAKDSGSEHSGVLCGRATWKDGIDIFVKSGRTALDTWLRDQGVRNIDGVNAAVRNATSWRDRLRAPALHS